MVSLLRVLLLVASVASAAKSKYCKGSFTTLTTAPPPTSTSTFTPNTASYPDSCTYRPTQTFYSSSGCSIQCSTNFCIIDAPATVPCGCPTVFIETQTVTVCPTTTPCYQCYTGWGTFVFTEPCSATGTASVSTTATPAVY